MSDGSIKFDVKLDTDEFCSDLKNMAKNSAKALELIDDAFNSGAVSGLKTLDSVFDSAFGKLINFSDEEKNFLLSFSDSVIKSEEERQAEHGRDAGCCSEPDRQGQEGRHDSCRRSAVPLGQDGPDPRADREDL